MKTLSILVLVLSVQVCLAQDSTTTEVTGFIDVYYAYSFQNHPYRDRSFTTQPLRHNEFNLSLGMIDIKHQAQNIRCRFALQTGTYVQSNLAAEPQLLKHVLEASVGTRLGNNVWVDLGIFPVAGSVNVDFAPTPNLLWRFEVRVFNSKDAVYPTRDGVEKADGFVVLSAAVSL